MPIAVTGDDLMVLASALLVRTRWIEPFQTTMLTGDPHGPWHDRRFDALYRTSTDLDQVDVAHGPADAVTAVRVRGSGGIDVILVLGEPDAEPGTVLAQGIAVGTGTHTGTREPVAAERADGDHLGPGMISELVESPLPDPFTLLHLPAFAVSSTYDLLHDAPLFGLRTVTDRGRGHFPGISTFPLAVSGAAQNVTATFGAEGFDAAAVTEFVMYAGGRGPEHPYRVRRLAITFDRPFGFVAVHRDSALVLTCGWIQDPGPRRDAIDLDELLREPDENSRTS